MAITGKIIAFSIRQVENKNHRDLKNKALFGTIKLEQIVLRIVGLIQLFN
jgi:hypothetical protein